MRAWFEGAGLPEHPCVLSGMPISVRIRLTESWASAKRSTWRRWTAFRLSDAAGRMLPNREVLQWLKNTADWCEAWC